MTTALPSHAPPTLYHCINARSFRPLWMLEELGLSCDLRVLPFPPRFAQREYLAANPLGTVPLLVDGATRMTESAAICHYLVTRNGPNPLAVGPDEPDYGAWLNALHYGETTLTVPQTLVLRYSRFEPAERRQPQVVADYTRWFGARLRGLDAILADGREWLCAGRFTAADVSVGYALMLAHRLALDGAFHADVAAYWQRLQQRAAYQRALAVQAAAAQAQGLDARSATDTGADTPG